MNRRFRDTERLERDGRLATLARPVGCRRDQMVRGHIRVGLHQGTLVLLQAAPRDEEWWPILSYRNRAKVLIHG